MVIEHVARSLVLLGFFTARPLVLTATGTRLVVPQLIVGATLKPDALTFALVGDEPATDNFERVIEDYVIIITVIIILQLHYPIGIPSTRKFRLLSPGKGSCDRVTLPNLRCMLGASVFP